MSGINYDILMTEFRIAVLEAGGQKHFARLHSISPAYVWGVMSGKQKAGYGILNALGYRKVVTFEKMERRHGPK